MATQTFRGITYTIRGLAANEPIGLGTALPDWIEAPLGNHLISTGAGDDVIIAGATFINLAGNPSFLSCSFSLTAGNQVIFAGAGNDYVVTGAGSDFVDLGDGDDIFYGDDLTSTYSVSDVILAGAGNDSIIGFNAGTLFIDGGAGNDEINNFRRGANFGSVEYKTATILGGDGNDGISIYAYPWQTILLDGGSGEDILSISGAKDGGNITVLGGSGNDSSIVYGNNNQRISIDMGSDNDYIDLELSSQKSVIASVNGGSGDDYFYSYGLSSDNLTVDMDGGIGNDFMALYYDTVSDEVGPSTIRVFGGVGDDTILSVSFESSSGLIVGRGAKSMYGGSGNDMIFSGQGNDTIYAGSGNDTINLRGGIAISPIFGDEFTVVGGGNDTVYLDSGSDKVILGSTGLATIYGFGSNDFLDITGLNATLSKSGGNTLIKSAGNTIGILKGYTGSVSLV
jgi:Ca2+-binding RTX toxin-like protein